MNLIAIHKIFYSMAAKNTFYSTVTLTQSKTFSATGHMIRHKARFNKYLKLEIILGSFSDDNAIKQKINNCRRS